MAHVDLATNPTLSRANRTLQINKERDRQKTETDEDLESKPLNQIRVDAKADSCREERDPLLPFSVDAIRHPDDTGDDSDEER